MSGSMRSAMGAMRGAMNGSMRGVFITGTDTNVGKTLVAAWLTSIGGYYWKPIQCGLDADGRGDTERVLAWSGRNQDAVLDPAMVFQAARSPHEAAGLEGRSIALSAISMPNRTPIIVEGAGGLLTPLTSSLFVADMIAHLALPTLLVARTALGTINHTLLSIEALKSRSIPLVGIVLSGTRDDANARSIETISHIPILARLPHLSGSYQAAMQRHGDMAARLFQTLFAGKSA